MRIGITGASGFIAGHVIDELLARGHEAIAFDRIEKQGFRKDVEFMLGDVRDETSVFELTAHVDGIIHLAAILGTQETVNKPIPAAQTNIFGSLNVFEAANRYNLPVVYAGVGNAHMRNTGAGSYTISKTCAEDFARMTNQYRNGNIAIVRPTNAFGPRQSVSPPFGSSAVRKIMPSFICRALTGMPIELYGGGTQISDCVYVTDVANVFVTALEFTANAKRPRQVVEVGPVESMSVRQIAELVIKITNSNSELVSLPMRIGETPNAIVKADTSTLAQIDVSPDSFLDIKEGIQNTIEYYKGYLNVN
jgi:UDP-glucose 4-epimerase